MNGKTTEPEQHTDNPGSLLEQIRRKYLGRQVTDARSPAGNWLQFTLERIEPGTAEISLTLKKEMTNPYGNIHGGMMALVMDETIGWAVISLEMPHHYTSLNLNVDFLYAIKEGDRLISRAHVVRAGKKIIHTECTVHHEDGTLLGKGSSNLVVTSMKLIG